MCKVKQPKLETPAVRRVAAPEDPAPQLEADFERSLRRQRSGVAADILTSPLGI